MSHSSDDPLIGRALGDFVLCEKVGEGGFGSVYRAEQARLGREAVIKVLRPLHGNSASVRSRFVQEARVASHFDHPFAAHVYDSGAEPDGTLWIAMEIVRGTTLDQWLQEHGPLPLTRFVPFFERVCEVVQSAHDQGIVHRDIKPANVMVLERAGQLLPKLLDFGIAKAQEEAAAPGPAPIIEPIGEIMRPDPERRLDEMAPRTASFALQTRGLIGSPPYMAPEQWSDPAGAGPASDLYALGVLAFEALCGKRPYAGSTVEEISVAHTSAPVPRLPGGFPPSVDAFFQRALAKDPAQRFGSAVEMATALQAAAAPKDRRGGRWRRVALAAAALLVACAASVWWLSGRLPAGSRRLAIEASASLPEDAWLARATGRLAARRLRDLGHRYAVVDEGANTLLALEVRSQDGEVLVSARLGLTWGRGLAVASARAPSVAQALDAILPAVDGRAGAGQPEDLTGETAAAARLGTSSLDAYRAYSRGFEAYASCVFADIDGARALAARGGQVDPRWGHAWALVVMAAGVFSDDAGRLLQQGLSRAAADRDPDGVRLLRAFEAQRAGRRVEATDLARQVAREHPDDLVANMMAMTGLANFGSADDAIAVARRLHEGNLHLQFGYDLADLLGSAGRRADQIAVVDRWVEVAPDAPQAFISHAAIQVQRGRVAEAERDLRRVLQVHGEVPNLMAPVVDGLLVADKPREAAVYAEKMLAGSATDRARGYYRLGVSAMMEGRLAAAWDSLQKGLPLCRALGNEGETTQTLESLRALAPFLGREKELPGLTADLVGVLEGFGLTGWAAVVRFEGALETRGEARPDPARFTAAITDPDERALARANMLRLAAEAGCGSCDQVVHEGLRAFDRGTHALYAFASCAERVGDLQTARSVFQRIRQIALITFEQEPLASPFHSLRARVRLAAVEERLGDGRAARLELEGLLALWSQPDRPIADLDEARRALQRLP